MWPIFIVDDPDDKQAIASMPGEKVSKNFKITESV